VQDLHGIGPGRLPPGEGRGDLPPQGPSSLCDGNALRYIFDPPVPLEGWPEGDRTSRIVVIARDVAKADLQDSLAVLRLRSRTDEADNEVEGLTGMPF
jgi:hypothetical protein